MMQLYNSNIFFNMAITFLEPLPVGVLMSLISAFILRKRRKAEGGEEQDLQDYRDGVKETSVNPV
jgi:hypothetical protein